MKVFISILSLLTLSAMTAAPTAEPSLPSGTGDLKPVISFEGVVTAVQGGSVTLNDGKTIFITADTVFGSDPNVSSQVSRDIRVGNFIQGYTADDVSAEEVIAGRIWTNEGRTSGGKKRVINVEGRVIQAEKGNITLDSGKMLRILESTTIAAPDGSPTEIAVGDYIQGYADNPENDESNAKYILVTTL